MLTPAELFYNGEQGAFYQVSDLSTLFQDSEGTIPVTEVGQPVGLMRDLSGNENHATAITSQRPTLQIDDAGHYYLNALAGHKMTAPIPQPLSSNIYMAFKAARNNTSTADGTGVSGVGIAGMRLFFYWSTLNRVSARIYNPYVASSLTSGAAPLTPLIMDIMARNLSGKLEHRTQLATGLSAGDSSWEDGIEYGTSSQVEIPMSLTQGERTYSFVIIWRRPSLEERNEVFNYLENPVFPSYDKLKIWSGSSWSPVKIWDGSTWRTDAKVWDGSEWV